MKPSTMMTLICTALLGLSACQKEEAPAQPAPQPPAAETPAATSGEDLIRQQPESVVANTIEAMQSKPYEDTTVHLTKARVAGPILTVEFVFEPPRKPDGKYDFVSNYAAEFDDLAYIDEASAQKVSLLQDENGKFSATPASSDGKRMRIPVGSKMTTVTLKYPAPPANVQSISINLPQIGSFDGIAISR